MSTRRKPTGKTGLLTAEDLLQDQEVVARLALDAVDQPKQSAIWRIARQSRERYRQTMILCRLGLKAHVAENIHPPRSEKKQEGDC